MGPRMCRCTNRPSVAEPEVYFRIVHVSLQGQNGGPVAAYRNQTVEIALGPKRAFEDGNIGTLTRRVRADRVVSAVPPPRGKPKAPKEPNTPRVAELMRKAIEWRGLLDAGEAPNQADIARREGLTRAHVTQVLMFRRLAPEIQEHILNLPKSVVPQRISERCLRPITKIEEPEQQAKVFESIISQYR